MELFDVNWAQDTPLLDLLDAIPMDGRHVYHAAQWSKNVPYGNLCYNAALEIRRLKAEIETIKKQIESEQ